jgi:ribosomal-protein-alanine N-acetyltransferase
VNINSKLQPGQPLLTTDFKNISWNEHIDRGVEFTFKDGSTFLIRKMVNSDIDDVLPLEQIIFSDPWTKETFLLELQNDRYVLALVGFIDNNLIAYEISQIIVDELHIHNFAIDPQFRRRGHGMILLWFLLKIASLNGISSCHLEVRRSNISAISLYKKFGFKVVGVRKQYYVNENEDAILMSLFM